MELAAIEHQGQTREGDTAGKASRGQASLNSAGISVVSSSFWNEGARLPFVVTRAAWLRCCATQPPPRRPVNTAEGPFHTRCGPRRSATTQSQQAPVPFPRTPWARRAHSGGPFMGPPTLHAGANPLANPRRPPNGCNAHGHHHDRMTIVIVTTPHSAKQSFQNFANKTGRTSA